MTLEDYLAREPDRERRYEFVSGEAYPKAAATTRHQLIVGNIYSAMRAPARAQGCRVFFESVMVRAARDRIYLPDVFVACGSAAEVELIVEAPTFIVEVTSPATRRIDRREKLDAYQGIVSLRGYLIVEQRWREALLYTRNAGGSWERMEVSDAGQLEIPNPRCVLTLDEIYDDVPLPPLGVREELLEEIEG